MLRRVPLYDFRCRRCGERFEELVAHGAAPPCPTCAAPDPERLLGSIAPPLRLGLRGREARRSNAVRRAREYQRQERRAGRKQRGDG